MTLVMGCYKIESLKEEQMTLNHKIFKLLERQKGLTQEKSLLHSIGISRSKLAGYELNVNPPFGKLW